MSLIARSAAPLLLLTVFAACGDDETSSSTDGGGGSATTTSGSSTTSGTTQTASTGGDGGGDLGAGGLGAGGLGGDGGAATGAGGQGGAPPFSCEDDAMICEHDQANAEACGIPYDDEALAACLAYVPCQRRLYRDDVECDLFTCRAENDTCEAPCQAVVDGIVPTESGQVFIDRCLEVMAPCQGDNTDLYCTTFGRFLADDVVEDFTACLEEPTCDDAVDCFDVAIISRPECPDL